MMEQITKNLEEAAADTTVHKEPETKATLGVDLDSSIKEDFDKDGKKPNKKKGLQPPSTDESSDLGTENT